MKARILILCIVLLAACQPVELDDDSLNTFRDKADAVCTLTLQATRTVDTKALDLVNGTRLNQYWKNTDQVKVFRNGTCIGTLAVVPDPNGGAKPTNATLSGSVEVQGLAKNDVLTLLIPGRADNKWDYTEQNGVLTGTSSIEDSFDYATATLSVSSIEGTSVHTTTSSVAFQQEQSIYRFDFKVNDVLKDVKWFTVSSSRNLLVTSRSYNNGWESNHGDLTVTLTGDGATRPYVSLRNENTTQADTYSFLVVGGDNALYSGNKEIPADKLGNGKFLAPGVALTKCNLHMQDEGYIVSQSKVL